MSARRASGRVRPTTPVFTVLSGLTLALAVALMYAAMAAPAGRARMRSEAELVRAVGLTDLALFTEARYARNPSMADLHTAFQDNPMSFEHFPSGVFVPRPEHFGAGTLSFGEPEQ